MPRSALARWFRPDPQPAQRAFEPPTYFASSYRSGLTTIGTPTNEALLANVLGWHAIAARAIADRIQSLEPIVLVRRRVAKGTVEEEELDDHILKVLLDDPNPIFTRLQLLRMTAYWIVTTGEAYWLKVQDRLRVTRELWPLSPANMTLETDPDEQIKGYVFTSERGQTRYERDEIVRFWSPSPVNPFLAVGNLGPQAIAADSAKFLDETLRDHFKNDATPKVALVAGDSAIAPTPEDKKRFEADWRQRYDNRRGNARGLPAILPTGYTPFEFTAFGGSVENVVLMNHYRDQILMANGVPRSILGDVVDANRAAAETNQFVFDRHTITPITDLIADTLTVRLAKDFDPKLIVKFKEFVSDDKDFELRSELQDLQEKVRSVNQVRDDRGLDPVEWGDEPIGTIADLPYDPEAARAQDLQPDDPNALGDPNTDPNADPNADPTPPDAIAADTKAPRSRAHMRAHFSSRRAWSRLVRRERLYVPRFQSAIISILAEQRDDVLSKLKDERSARINLEDLFNITAWARLFRLRVEPVRRKILLDTAAETMLGLGMPATTFVFNDVVTKQLATQGAQLVTNVNATTKKRLAAAMAEGQAQGESGTQIAARVRDVFKGRRGNAMTIARTEVLKATEWAQLESFKQSGVVEKRMWNTSLDDAVRDSHGGSGGGGVDGQVRVLGDPFQLDDGELADAPGIGAGGAPLSAANACNCRCFLTPVIE